MALPAPAVVVANWTPVRCSALAAVAEIVGLHVLFLLFRERITLQAALSSEIWNLDAIDILPNSLGE